MSIPVVAWVDEMPDPGTYTKTTEDERKVLAAIRAGTHVLVPKKPTPAMLRAAEQDEDNWRRMPYPSVRYELQWEAMLAAAEPPA